ncbi:MAG: N-acetylmuramoyl-L-alanine amidase [Tepidanaerobacteraceae bacterium]
MKQGITNVYIATTPRYSALTIESLKTPNCSINKIHEKNYEISLDSPLIMAPDAINVFDGLVNTAVVTEKNEKAIIKVSLEYPCAYQLKVERNLPERLIIFFDRSVLTILLKDKVIVIDPGHGGKDFGRRGHINLLEKNVVMDVANYLKEELNLYGARAVMTRERDICLNTKDRINTALLLEAEMYISLHTNWDRNKKIHGAKGTYYEGQGKILCESILRELEKKPGIKNLGANQAEKVFEKIQCRHISKMPIVTIEVCTISNPVEEGWLRSPVFKKRLANAIKNGISNYFFLIKGIDL